MYLTTECYQFFFIFSISEQSRGYTLDWPACWNFDNKWQRGQMRAGMSRVDYKPGLSLPASVPLHVPFVRFFFYTFKSISLCTIKLGKLKYLGTRWIIFLHTLLVISINPGEFFTNPCKILQDVVKNLPKHFAFPRFLYFEWWTKNSQIYHGFFKYDHLIFNFFKEQFYFQILIFLISSSS